jgi:hypothetical protein
MFFSRKIFLLWEVETKARMTGPPTRILRAVYTKSKLVLDQIVLCEAEAKLNHKASRFFIKVAKTNELFIIDEEE